MNAELTKVTVAPKVEGVASFLERRFRRITTSGHYLPEIDGLRFIAIFWVVLLHTHGHVITLVSPASVDNSRLAAIVNWGNAGVQLFFAISGFILALPFAEQYLRGGQKISLRRYYYRRVTRLEPPYIVAMLICFLLLLVSQRSTIRELLPHLAASLAYLHNIIYHQGSVLDGVAWSLEVEIQFYILAPLFGRIFQLSTVPRRLLMVGLIVFCSSGILSNWLMPVFDMPFETIVGEVQFFLVGFLLADFYLMKSTSARGQLFLDVTGLIALVALPFVYADTKYNWLAFPVGITILYIAVLFGKWIKLFFANPIICTIGGMCYSIYLIHLPVLSGIFALTRHFKHSDSYELNLLIQSAVMLPGVLACSSIFYLLIERPCMDKNWPKKLWGWVRSKVSHVDSQ
jgi:peptidoglycan/LPS O-acetylase OafA/YrhL